MRLPRFTCLTLARGLAAASIPFAALATTDLLGVLGPVTAALFTLAAGLRRWRFPAAVALGVSACQHLLMLEGHDLAHLAALEQALSCLCAALAAIALMWPRLEAESEDAPLPQLPGTWVLLSTLIVSACDAALLFGQDEALSSNPGQVLITCGFSALWLFAGFMIASLSGPMRWPLQLFSALVSLWTSLAPPFDQDGAQSRLDLHLAALAAPAFAFALGFDWIRAGRTSWRRMLRAGGLAFALGLLPALVAAPHQLTLVALGRVLAQAAAYAIAAGLLPRVVAHRRFSPLRYGSRSPEYVAVIIAGAAVLPIAAIVAKTASHALEVGAALLIWVVIVFVAAFFRVRVARALLWLLTTTPLVALCIDGNGRGFYAFLGTAFAAGVAWLLSSPTVSQHFPRRVRLVPDPRPRVAFAFAAVIVAALTAALFVEVGPRTRGALLAALPGPVIVKAPLLFVPPPPPVPTTSPVRVADSLAVDWRGTWVVDEENDEVVLMKENGAHRAVKVGAWPQRLLIDGDGNVFVSCREAQRIDVIGRDFAVRSMPIDGEPRAMALDPRTNRLYVGLVTAHQLLALDTEKGGIRGRLALPWSPYEVAIAGGQVAALPRVGGSVVLATLDLRESREETLGTNDRDAWHGQALVPVGDDLLVAYAGVDTGMSEPTVTSEGGYGGTVRTPVELHVAMLHRGRTIVVPPPLDETLAGEGADITGAAVHGDQLALVSRGTGQLLEIPLTSLAGLRVTSRLPLAPGATGLVRPAEGEWVTYAAFDRALYKAVGTNTERAGVLGASRLDNELQLGRKLFHQSDERRISNAGLSCAMCHPDGREDGLVWRLKGTRVQTPMLAAKLAETAPYNWHGTSPTLEANIAQTVKRLGGTGLTEPETQALARYLREGLHAPKPPAQAAATMVALGREVFSRPSVGCADCHTLDGTLTDGARHDVGTFGERERAELLEARGESVLEPAAFDTPSLIGVGLTAPYFHNGSAPTLEALVAQNGDHMGHTSGLTERERRALVAFLKTL
jgi:hypothetical protein